MCHDDVDAFPTLWNPPSHLGRVVSPQLELGIEVMPTIVRTGGGYTVSGHRFSGIGWSGLILHGPPVTFGEVLPTETSLARRHG
jgi:hypothetical protein